MVSKRSSERVSETASCALMRIIILAFDCPEERSMRSLRLLCLTLLCLPQIAAAQTWLIGEITPLTGPAATVGTRMTKVVRMWAEEVNARGGIAGAKIDIITCNEENRPEKAGA